jgi:hypothetical protein
MTTDPGALDGRTACTVDELLAEARSSLPGRPSPCQALAAQATGALLIDIRGDDQRRSVSFLAAYGISRPRRARSHQEPRQLESAVLEFAKFVRAVEFGGLFQSVEAVGQVLAPVRGCP